MLMSLVAHLVRIRVFEVGVNPGFRSMNRLAVFLLTSDGMLVHRRVTPPQH